MNAFKKLAAAILAVTMLLLTACTPTPAPQPPEETTQKPIEPETGDKVYNIIFALATIPPVLSALDCIENGYETYAIIERGKTYNGIDKLEHFHNAGFDPANNLSTGFTETEFNAMTEKISELKGENVFFNIYVQDGTALRGAAIAANAGLTKDSFRIYMCEDGTGAYDALKNKYIKGKTVTEDKDEIYEGYNAAVEAAKAEFDTVMSKTDNKNNDSALKYNIGKAFALAALPNFVYYLQDESIVIDALESTGEVKTKLLSSFGVEGYDQDTEYSLNLKYQKISEAIDKLTETQKSDYLTLMYGDYFADTEAALKRSERAGESAPDQKLVFIGSRHSGYPKLASDAKYGIGGLSGAVPRSYDELDDKYKSPLLFSCEADYELFLDVLDEAVSTSSDPLHEAKVLAETACFNIYIDYIFNLKLIYSLYGADYDIIMKGHPREAIGCYEEWGGKYKVTYGEEDNKKTYVYDKLLDSALLAFHESDSTGKYIGMVPYGTAAENLAYLGVDIAIGGLPSSTYSGYDTDVDVLFILAETGESISGDASQVKERYEAGNLVYSDKDGTEKPTAYYNVGNIYKAVASILENAESTDLAKNYQNRFKLWLTATHGINAADIDAQGFAVQK